MEGNNKMTREQFIGAPENWDNHRFMLWEALEATTGTVIEMGVGKGSTLQLHDYCKANGRKLYSYEYDFEWFKKYKHLNSEDHQVIWVDNDWDMVNRDHSECDVLFIDHSPGERRKEDIKLFFNKAKIIVAHDTEPSADFGYQMREPLSMYKYMKDHEAPGAWTTAVSNEIDVTGF